MVFGRVGAMTVRARTVEELNKVDPEPATQVARGVGVPEPSGPESGPYKLSSPALSLESVNARTG
jgi:catalase